MPAVNVTGASGETTVIWSLYDVNLCTGDTLGIFKRRQPMPIQPRPTWSLGDTITVTVIDEQGCEACPNFIWTVEQQHSDTHRNPNALCSQTPAMVTSP